jgi:uncharacterized glyoxalase superfamily protein PhnB
MSTATTTVSCHPILLYRDADAAMRFLEALGFERLQEHRDGDGQVVHAEMRLGDAVVMLGTAGAGREPFRSVPAGNGLLYCALDDVDGLAARARTAGAEIVIEPMDTDYGSRDFTLRDPEGNLWSFGTYRPQRDGGA